MKAGEIVVCDDCGGQRRPGDWPFCKGDPKDHEPSGGFGYDPLEPYFDEDICEEGMVITTRDQRIREMNKRNLEFRKPKGYQGKVLYCDLGGR